MVKNIKDFNNGAFIDGAKQALSTEGFVTDEHEFAPYRDVLVNKATDIASLLKSHGLSIKLKTGVINTDFAGKVFYIYDADKYNETNAKEAVLQWIDSRYR